MDPTYRSQIPAVGGDHRVDVDLLLLAGLERAGVRQLGPDYPNLSAPEAAQARDPGSGARTGPGTNVGACRLHWLCEVGRATAPEIVLNR